jgi:hypothetical protein
MSDAPQPTVTRQRRVPAITALGVAGVLALEAIVSALFGAISMWGYGGLAGGESSYVWGIGLDLLRNLAATSLSIGLGVFLTFAFLAAITATLSLRQVVVRSLLATALGCAVMFVVRVLLGILLYGSFSTGMFGASFPAFALDGSSIAFIFIDAVGSVARTLVSVAPTVVLAGVFQWMWCGRRTSAGNRVSASETGAPGQV